MSLFTLSLTLLQGLPPGEMGSNLGSRDSSVSEQCVSPLNPLSSSAVATAKQSLRYRTNSSSARPSRPSSDEQELVEEQIHRCAKVLDRLSLRASSTFSGWAGVVGWVQYECDTEVSGIIWQQSAVCMHAGNLCSSRTSSL